ncbi:carbohydrate kinase family protein [Deinococcus apachensis]|uniref:carbohydrate kinase family protein n=1 Tax=Deinococcus apachensis TaxID=309886 RepID=UPI000377E7A6|nr:carbohydrate kinase family protein [Deinococcus apachensis]
MVRGNVNLEPGFAASSPTLPAVERAEYPGALTLGVSGVGLNVANALTRLGAEVRRLAFLEDDPAGKVIRETAGRAGIQLHPVLAPATPLSLVLSAPEGVRQIYRDLKGLPERAAPIPLSQDALAEAQVAVLTNATWTRELLPLAQAVGVPVVTDLQATPGPTPERGKPLAAPRRTRYGPTAGPGTRNSL